MTEQRQADILDVLRELYRQQGFIIIAAIPGSQLHLGELVDNLFRIPIKSAMVVEGFATPQEWRKQTELARKLRPEWEETWKAADKPGVTFCRVVAEKDYRKRSA